MYAWIPAMLPGSGPATQGTVSAALVNRIIRGAVNLGASRPVLISVLGFNEARLRNPVNRMAWQLVERLFSELEKQFEDPAAVLRLGDAVIAQSFSDIGYLTRLAPNLAAVIEANCQVQAIRQNVVSVELDQDPSTPCLRWDPVDREYRIDRFVEFSISTYAQLGLQVLGEPMKLQAIHFKHAPRFDEDKYHSVFGCHVHFNMTQSAAFLNNQQLLLSSPHADQDMLEAAMDHYKIGSQLIESGKPNAGNGFFYLSSELDKSPPTLAMMSASFGVSERTLRRRLDDEGYPFRELLNMVRHSLWKLYHQENRHSLGDIAHKLGFGELSAFSRAHRQWFGRPPSEF
jgi:AraC-like DNA-binding protein